MDRGKHEHELFGRCVHSVNRIPLFIGEGIKFYLCVVVVIVVVFLILAKKIHISLGNLMQQMYLFCVVGVCTALTASGLFLVFLFFPAVFTVSVPHEQTVFPPELMERNLIALHFLPAWLQFGANSKHYTYSILCLRAFIWS